MKEKERRDWAISVGVSPDVEWENVKSKDKDRIIELYQKIIKRYNRGKNGTKFTKTSV